MKEKTILFDGNEMTCICYEGCQLMAIHGGELRKAPRDLYIETKDKNWFDSIPHNSQHEIIFSGQKINAILNKKELDGLRLEFRITPN